MFKKFFQLFSFSARFARIQKTFVDAIKEAEELNMKMDEAILKEEETIQKKLQKIKDHKDLQDKNKNFITNLTNLIS